MDIFTAYKTLDSHLLNVVKSINILETVADPVKADYVRLEENPFVLTEETKRCCGVVTAHDLQQYKSKFHAFSLEDSVHTWLEELLKIDEREDIEE